MISRARAWAYVCQGEGRHLNVARTNAWLAICRLASETANNETAPEDECPQRYHISKERDREPFENCK